MHGLTQEKTMSTLPADPALPQLHPGSWPASRFLAWLGATGRMLRQAPLRFLLLCLLPMLVEALLQWGIPVAGVVASKLLVPLVSAACLIATDQRVRSGRFAPMAACRRLFELRARWLWISLLSAAIFAWQLIVARAVAGPAAMHGLLTADPAGIARFSRATLSFVLAAGVLPGMLLLTALPRLVLDGWPVGAALRENARWVRSAWKPAGIYFIVSTALVAGFVLLPWLLLALLPFGYMGYWIYRDVAEHVAAR